MKRKSKIRENLLLWSSIIRNMAFTIRSGFLKSKWLAQVFSLQFPFIASKLSLKISNDEFLFRNTQKQPFAGVLQNKCSRKFWEFHRRSSVSGSLFKKRLRPWCFLKNFAQILRAPFLQNTFKRLLLYTKTFIKEKGISFSLVAISIFQVCLSLFLYLVQIVTGKQALLR